MPTATSRATSADGGEEAVLLETREVLPGRHLLTLAAPSVARRAAAGQYVSVIEPRPRGLLLPALSIAGFDRSLGRIEVHLASGVSSPAEGLLRTRPGDLVTLEGPLGRGFEIDARSRYLLVVADADGLARVRSVADEAVATGRRVTLLYGARTVSDVLPSSLLPDEVEYVVATSDGSLGHRGTVTELLTSYEAWADQCFAAGAPALLAELAALAKGREARMGVARLGRRRGRRAEPGAEVRRRAWLQVALPLPVGCALGVCLGCVRPGADGPLRTCREGPAFAASELRWEPGA